MNKSILKAIEYSLTAAGLLIGILFIVLIIRGGELVDFEDVPLGHSTIASQSWIIATPAEMQDEGYSVMISDKNIEDLNSTQTSV